MSDNAVMNKKLSKDLQKAIDETINIELEDFGYLERNQPRNGPWVTFNSSSFSLITRGEAITEFKNGMMTKRPQGILCYFPEGSLRRTIVSNKSGADFVWLRCFFTIFNGFNLLSVYQVPYIFTKKSSCEFLKIHKKLLALNTSDEFSPFETAVRRKELCYSFLKLVLSESQLKPEAFKKIRQLQRFVAVVKYMKKHFKEPVNIEELAVMAYLSKSQFHRQFKATFGIAPFEYMKKIRIQNAIKLLQNSDLSISEIGEACGWNDQFHFSRIFKSSVGLSPGIYRERMRSDLENFIAGL
jgi:AraC-like DNA-binding protein